MKNLIILVFLGLFTLADAGSNYKTGKIKNLTVGTSGIKIMLDTGVPDNCSDTPFGWMLIKEEHRAMTAVVLSAWASGRTLATVYTSGRENGTGSCLINQFHPSN